jgi:hypothetical protein
VGSRIRWGGCRWGAWWEAGSVAPRLVGVDGGGEGGEVGVGCCAVEEGEQGAGLAALEGDGGAGAEGAVEDEGDVAGGVGASCLGGRLVAQVGDRGGGGMDDLSEDVDLDHAADPAVRIRPRAAGSAQTETVFEASPLVTRSVAVEEVGEFGALPVGEAGEGFAGGDAAAGEGAVGAGGADAGHAQQQVANLGAGGGRGRVVHDGGEVDAAAGDVVFEVGAGDADGVGMLERAQPLLPRLRGRPPVARAPAAG